MSQALLDALEAQASAAGISGSEAVRQFLERYLANPCDLPATEMSELGSTLPPIRVSKNLAAAVMRDATEAGVSVAETIRRVLTATLSDGT